MIEIIPGITPIYSPSATSLFKQCQMKWWLRTSGWKLPSMLTRKDVTGAMGNAFHVAAKAYMLAEQSMRGNAEGYYIEMAKEYYFDWFAANQHLGLDDKAQADNEDAMQIISAMVKAFYNQTFFDEVYDIVEVENQLVDYGNCIPDLVLRDRHGLIDVDYKTRTFSSDFYKRREIDEFHQTRQMLHYTWAIQHKYQEPVERCMLVIIPRNKRPRIESYTKYVDVHYREGLWLASSLRTWHEMRRCEVDQVPQLADMHRDNFGTCEFAKACLDHHLDPETMIEDYIQELEVLA